MTKNPDKNRSLIICLILAISTFIIYYRVHSFEFVHYDDDDYVSTNPHVLNGLTASGVKWAFTTIHTGYWHALTWLSLMLDCQLFGPGAGGFHLTNLFFHIANTLLLFMVLKKMTGALWQSAFVAGLFAIHPMHVESVAWVSERKDVLSAFFSLLSMLAYVRYVKKPGAARYLLVLLIFMLCLMAKPMSVTLPFVLLLLDYWPLERKISPRLLVEKIPLFALSVVTSIVTFFAQQNTGTVASVNMLSLGQRIANVLSSYIQYINKMFWPQNLAVFYPIDADIFAFRHVVMCVLLLLVISVFVILFGRSRKYLLIGWFWFLCTLIPVIGIVQVGLQAYADRYTYVPYIGLFIMIAWGLPQLLSKWIYRKIILGSLMVIVLTALGICAHRQTSYWKNTVTLFSHALAVTQNNYIAYKNLAVAFINEDRFAEAETECQNFLRIEPNSTDMINTLGDILSRQGKYDKAVKYYDKALEIKPDYVRAINGLGMVLCDKGEIDEAIGYYKRAIKIDPNFDDAYCNLAAALAAKGRYAEAVEEYKTAMAIKDTSFAHNGLGLVLMRLGRFPDAAAEYRLALSAAPNDPNILNDLGYALANSGKLDEAVSFYNKALQIAPDSVNTRLNLGAALFGSGRLDEAAKEYERILQIQPRNARAHNDLGVILSQQKKFDQAIAHFNQSLQIDPGYIDARNNLSIALAEKDKLKSTENTKKK